MIYRKMGSISGRQLLFMVTSSLIISRNRVDGQGRPGLWEQAKNDKDRDLPSPTLTNRLDEDRNNDAPEVWWKWWESGAVGAHFPDIFENKVIPTTKEALQLAAPLFGDPPFFCIDIPKMLYESYTVEQDSNGAIRFNLPRKRDTFMDNFNKEGVGYDTQQRRSKSRYLNAYSLFWIMEPTSYRWNRRVIPRYYVPGPYGVPVDILNWTTRESLFNPNTGGGGDWLTKSPFANPEFDPYSDVIDGRPTDQFRWQTIMDYERATSELLFWHVEVTGIRDSSSARILKGWYHLKITLRKDTAGNIPVPFSRYSIDRLAVSARGLTFNHEFHNTGGEGFHTKYGSDIDRYFDINGNYLSNRPHRVWEGGAGEFVRDFPKCRGIPEPEYVERQFVPCGTTGKNQWYYGNNFILVNTDYPEYPDKSGMYGGGVIVNGDHEEVHLNYKLDQSFCNMYLAVDFVVNGVVISKKDPTFNVRTKNSRQWITEARLYAQAVERSSSTRISFVVDDHVEDPQPIAQSCENPALPLRQFTPPIIKQGPLPELTFYGNADPIPKWVDDELDCFVPLNPFNPTPNQPQPEESFHGAIQDILRPETFTSTPRRGLTLTYWYLYIRPFSKNFCIKNFRGNCQTYADFSHLIRDEVKEWDWRKPDPSDFSDLFSTSIKKRWELTQVPYLDGTFKGFWVSYFDFVGSGLDAYKNDPKLNASLIRYGSEVGWPTSRQTGDDPQGFIDDSRIGSVFQPLYFKPVPFVGRATADKSHQMVYSGLVPQQNEKVSRKLSTPFSGEPGHAPPACDLYVSRYHLRILDPDDDQYYNKDVGFPNDPRDTCFVNTPRLTTDPALQYIRKVYVKPRRQNVGGVAPRPTWYETYVSDQSSAAKGCRKAGNVKNLLPQRKCPSMPPRPYTTPGVVTTTGPTVISLIKREAILRGLRMDNPISLYIWDSRVIHGIWMTILAHFLVPLALILDRFYGDYALQGRRIYRMHGRWYNFRYVLALIILPIIGMGLQRQIQSSNILGWSFKKAARVHWKAGWLMVFNSLFVAIVWSTPLRKTRFFKQFGTLIKNYCGGVIKCCIVLCMITSLLIPASPVALFDVSDFNATPQLLFGGSFLWLVFIWEIFDVIVLVFMTIWNMEIDNSDLSQQIRGSRARHSASPMAAILQHFKHNTKIRRKKSKMIIIYSLASLIITVVISHLIATTDPIRGSDRGLGFMSCTHYENGTVRGNFPKNCPKID